MFYLPLLIVILITDIKVNNENHTVLTDLIKSALDNFKKLNKNFMPKSVIIYRQRGNEKQTEKLVRVELPKIIDIFSGGYEVDYKPKLPVFCVNKKTALKFFQRQNGGYRNIPTETIIDREVISPDLFEYYLQCPEVDRGTGPSVHFLCLPNTNEDLTANDFEEITYMQIYYYWN